MHSYIRFHLPLYWPIIKILQFFTIDLCLCCSEQFKMISKLSPQSSHPFVGCLGIWWKADPFRLWPPSPMKTGHLSLSLNFFFNLCKNLPSCTIAVFLKAFNEGCQEILTMPMRLPLSACVLMSSDYSDCSELHVILLQFTLGMY